jgi:hypothetical protein
MAASTYGFIFTSLSSHRLIDGTEIDAEFVWAPRVQGHG